MRQEQGSEHVNLDDSLDPCPIGLLVEREVPQTGVVDEDIRPAMPSEDALAQAAERSHIGEITGLDVYLEAGLDDLHLGPEHFQALASARHENKATQPRG